MVEEEVWEEEEELWDWGEWEEEESW